MADSQEKKPPAELKPAGRWFNAPGIILLLALILTFLPHLYLSCFPPAGQFYPSCTTASLDTATYYMWAREARSNFFHWENRHTPEQDSGGYFNLAWAAVGGLSRLSGADIPTAYRLLWLGANLALILITLRFARRFLAGENARGFACALILLGSGWGALASGAGFGGGETFFPADLTIPETHFFHAMLAAPHFPLALALMLSALGLFLSALETRRFRTAALSGVCALLLSFTHLYDVITLWGIAAIFGLALAILRRLRREDLKYFLALLLPTLPALWYFSWLTSDNPLLQAWKEQNVCRSPSVGSYLWGFAPMLLLLIFRPGFFRRWREKSTLEIFLWSWLIGGALLLYSFPLLNFERRLVMGWSVPLVLLGTQSFFTALEKLSSKWRGPAIALALGLCLFGTPAALVMQFSPRLITLDERQALSYLESNAQRGDVVLAGPHFSEWTPAYSDCRAFATRTALTVALGEKLKLSRRFLSGRMSPEEARDFLKTWHVRYIIFTGETPPDYAALLPEVFRSGAVRILKNP